LKFPGGPDAFVLIYLQAPREIPLLGPTPSVQKGPLFSPLVLSVNIFTVNHVDSKRQEHATPNFAAKYSLVDQVCRCVIRSLFSSLINDMIKSLAVWVISVCFALVSLVAISITWSTESYTSVIVLPGQMSGST